MRRFFVVAKDTHGFTDKRHFDEKNEYVGGAAIVISCGCENWTLLTNGKKNHRSNGYVDVDKNNSYMEKKTNEVSKIILKLRETVERRRQTIQRNK